ncbi:hypothetical protein [Pedobacter panaciterrae]|uniref:hypothetical protein n=1 Tax=Pedobacter panaciterrae TaxID=363849 RepID=UPI002595939E|nr:hypothetical protein [uncultured Pedobacter sp.]
MKLKAGFYKFIYRFQISICIGFGMLGFIIAILLFTVGNGQMRDGKYYTGYGEIQIKNKKAVIDALIAKRIVLLDSSLVLTTETLKKDPNSEVNKNNLIALEVAILRSRRELDSVRYNSVDTSLTNYTKYIFPKKVEYLNALDSPWKPDGSEIKIVQATIVDSCKLINKKIRPEQRQLYSTELELIQNKRASLLGFINDYPQFGLWLVLTIAQMMMWFLLIPLLTGNLLNLREKLGEYYKISLIGILQRMIIPFLFIGIFCIYFYVVLAERHIINDNYFLSNYNACLNIYAIFGYGTAIYCFGTYLSLASQVSTLDNNTKGILRSTDSTLNDQYLSLKSAFDNSFLASALILSFYVLWTGVSINAVNNTEAIKFYSQINGKPLIPEDFVYLMGLTHTCILLTFYLPVKLKFNSLPITKDTNADQSEGTPAKTIFSTVREGLSTILVTASPLLASLIQKILDALN